MITHQEDMEFPDIATHLRTVAPNQSCVFRLPSRREEHLINIFVRRLWCKIPAREFWDVQWHPHLDNHSHYFFFFYFFYSGLEIQYNFNLPQELSNKTCWLADVLSCWNRPKGFLVLFFGGFFVCFFFFRSFLWFLILHRAPETTPIPLTTAENLFACAEGVGGRSIWDNN